MTPPPTTTPPPLPGVSKSMHMSTVVLMHPVSSTRTPQSLSSIPCSATNTQEEDSAFGKAPIHPRRSGPPLSCSRRWKERHEQPCLQEEGQQRRLHGKAGSRCEAGLLALYLAAVAMCCRERARLQHVHIRTCCSPALKVHCWSAHVSGQFNDWLQLHSAH